MYHPAWNLWHHDQINFFFCLKITGQLDMMLVLTNLTSWLLTKTSLWDQNQMGMPTPCLESAKYLSSTLASTKIHPYMRSQVCDTWHTRLHPLPDTWGTFTVISFRSTLPSDLRTSTCVMANGINEVPGTEENELIQRKLTGKTFYTFKLCLELQIFERKTLSENWVWQQPY